MFNFTTLRATILTQIIFLGAAAPQRPFRILHPFPPKREVSELVSENNGPVAGRILDEMIASSLGLAKRSWRITATVKVTLVKQSYLRLYCTLLFDLITELFRLLSGNVGGRIRE
ncbi:hypothetical protein B0H13DRAFT_2266787 [Mycena leptocephala]|nr:hypothetical protein B0H13DRAFT_2266787 [Mycena leptocephala]